MRPAAIVASLVACAAGASGCDWFDGGSDATPPSCDPAHACCSEPLALRVDGGDAGLPPTDPGGPPPDGTGSVVFAIETLYYGDTGWDGVTDPEAWRQFGLNIDGKTTTGSSTDVCTLATGTSPCSQIDGENGIDNSFGLNVLPILQAFFGYSVSQNGDAFLRGGDSTLLVALDGLGAADDSSPLGGVVYHAAPLATPPAWNGTDVRDVDTASLVGGSLTSPVVTLGGYMSGRTWVGTANGGAALLDLHLTEDMDGAPGPDPPLPLGHVAIVMHVDPGNGTANGILTGVIATSDLVSWGQAVAGWASSSLCTTSAVQTVVQVLDQTSDILHDGTNQPGVACDGVSVGIGFDAVAVKLGSVVSLPAAPDPCADAGDE